MELALTVEEWQVLGEKKPTLIVGDSDVGNKICEDGWDESNPEDYVLVFFADEEKWPFLGPVLVLHLERGQGMVRASLAVSLVSDV